MSEKEQEVSKVPRKEEEADVEGHSWRRAGSEAPETAGERSEESDEPDVEGHSFRR